MVVLRETFLESDIDWITEACQDPDIQRWTLVPRPYTRDHARHFVEHPELERQRWVIEHDGDPIGVIGVHGVNENGDAEIGYWLAPRGRGMRVMASAVSLVAELLATDSSVRALTARIAEGNTASRRTAERAGFVEAERIECGCRDGEEPTDAILYRRVSTR
ncbi:MAG: GNAT family N-acetyltransferase [Ilumatobacteraceae bacterium]|jgi:RimJ/RimL family protein N-acetyltransferase|nr:GNAT family N-acetyltransferase [Ilumatobacteraceae bacterium]